jgi:hypothetical protein
VDDLSAILGVEEKLDDGAIELGGEDEIVADLRRAVTETPPRRLRASSTYDDVGVAEGREDEVGLLDEVGLGRGDPAGGESPHGSPGARLVELGGGECGGGGHVLEAVRFAARAVYGVRPHRWADARRRTRARPG